MNKFLKRSFVGRNDVVLYIVGVIAVFAGYFLGQIPMVVAQYMAIRNNPDIDSEALSKFSESMDFSMFGLSSNQGFLLMLMIFVFAMLALLGILMVHKKSIHDISTGRRSIDWKRVLWGFGVWFALGLAFEAVMYAIEPDNYIFQFKGTSFIWLVLICLLIMPIQTTWEEWFFRGYIFQGLVALTRTVWIPVAVTTLLFAVVHGSNPEVAKYGVIPMMSYYIMAGFFLVMISIWDEGLELAMGIHAATNIFGASILSYDGSVLQTDTLVKTSEINPWIMAGVFLLSAILFIYLARMKYKFKVDFTILSQSVRPNEDTLKEI